MTRHDTKVLGGVQLDCHSSVPRANYCAACSCGWLGVPQATRKAAERDGDDHAVAAS